jgi:alanine-synthesizing transaminase
LDLRRIDRLPRYVFDVVDEWKAEAARRGDDVIDFGIGSPDLGTPEPIVDRLLAAARDARYHGYPTSAGTFELRTALAAWYERRYEVVVDPETQVLVTWGASDGMAHLPWVLLGPGDTALVPEPCYPIHRYAVLFSGATPIGVPIAAVTTDAEAGDPDDDVFAAIVKAYDGAARKPRAVVISFPHNPTTRCVGIGFFARLVDFARRRNLFIVHDFAYADIAFDGYRPSSVLQAPGAADVAVELVSLSKSYNMAGWRLGFAAGNAQVIGGLRRLKSYLDYGVTTPIQMMARTALEECDDVPTRVAALYQARRDALCDGLAAIGWPVAKPRGTMFVWARLPLAWRAHGSLAFARRLLDEAHVAVAPGIGFGESGDDHVRFALVQPEERIAQALRGIARALAEPPTR